MFLPIWPIKPYLKHSTAFLSQSPKLHILSRSSIVRSVEAIPIPDTNSVLVIILLLWTGSRAMTTLIKETIYVGLAYNFRRLVQCHHGGAHDCIQANMILEKLEFYILNYREHYEWATGPGFGSWDLKTHPQRCISSSNTTPTPTRPYLIPPT